MVGIIIIMSPFLGRRLLRNIWSQHVFCCVPSYIGKQLHLARVLLCLAVSVIVARSVMKGHILAAARMRSHKELSWPKAARMSSISAMSTAGLCIRIQSVYRRTVRLYIRAWPGLTWAGYTSSRIEILYAVQPWRCFGAKGSSTTIMSCETRATRQTRELKRASLKCLYSRVY